MPAEHVESPPVDPCLREDGAEDQRLHGSVPIVVEDDAEETLYLDDMFRELQEDMLQ